MSLRNSRIPSTAPFDPKSIMMFSVPAGLAEGLVVEWNTKFSEGDRSSPPNSIQGPSGSPTSGWWDLGFQRPGSGLFVEIWNPASLRLFDR